MICTAMNPTDTPQFTPISFTQWESDPQAFASALGASLTQTGFAVISDHTIANSVIETAERAAQQFFALPEAVKRGYHEQDGGGQRGYTPFGEENAKGASTADQKEFWHTGRVLPDGSAYASVMKPTPSVTEVGGFDSASRDMFDALDEFGNTLLSALALYLELPEHWFHAHVQWGNSILRLLHYPAQEVAPPKGSVRAGAHEDINLITLLLGAQEAGLQVKHACGAWLDVNPSQGDLVLNCGDMLQRLTGGLLPSTSHRVLNPSPERARFPRYSMPFFLHPNFDFEINALEGCLAKGGVAQPAITAGEFLYQRLVQIGLIKP